MNPGNIVTSARESSQSEASGLVDPSHSRVETEYFAPFQRIPIPVHSMGPDGLLLEVNAAWVEYTGFSKSQAVGRSFASFLDPESATRYRGMAVPEIVDIVRAPESRSVEYRLIKASGETVDIVLTARPERDPNTGRFLHSLSVINDITARNRAEMALRQAQKLEALGSLTSGVAHDFNNLLMIILGSLQLLEKRLPPDNPRTARLVDAALQGARRGAALTSRLLAFARQQELTPTSLEPRALFASVRQMLKHLLGPSIRVEEDLDQDVWNLRADPNQLELALLNLAANARDAMPDGGSLRLSARNATVTAPESTFHRARAHPEAPPGEHVVLTISDTGSGMDEVALARAADPFFTTKGPGKGTGLGLSMVHGFAVQSGGALLLSSQPGAGTSVELWLPRTLEPAPGPESEEPAARHVSQATGPVLRILLVDDDPLVVAGTIGMLEELGHADVHAVSSAEEALVVLREDAGFDLLLTDHVMPGMSGVKLAALARELYPGLPIVIASGFTELDALAGVRWPRLRKPYSLNDLEAALAPIGPRHAVRR
jgi:PAS domain S-box-containing protein